jgi:hypothetical protein
MISHENTSEDGHAHLVRANPLWEEIPVRWLARQPKGRAYVLARGGLFAPGLAHFLERPHLLDIRDRVSEHGGHTKLVL